MSNTIVFSEKGASQDPEHSSTMEFFSDKNNLIIKVGGLNLVIGDHGILRALGESCRRQARKCKKIRAANRKR